MRCRFVLLISLLGTSQLWAERWIKVPGPNFTVYTNAGDSRGRDIVLRMEHMRRVFPVLIPRQKLTPVAPVVVVAFKDHRDLEQLAPPGKPTQANAFFLHGDDRNFIVVDTNLDGDWQPAYRDYARFMLEINLPRTPLWWDEGFADYFSTLRFARDKFILGIPPAGYMDRLREAALPLDRLLALTPHSPDYKTLARDGGEFSARSWLLVHYLLSNKKLSQAMRYFDLTLNQQISAPAAVQQGFNITLKELSAALRAHGSSAGSLTDSYQLPVMEKLSYSIEAIKESAAEALVADLYLHANKQSRAEQDLRRLLLSGAAESAAAHAGLGHLYLQKNEIAPAKEEFRKATELGSDDAFVWYFAALTDLKEKGLQDRDSLELIRLNANLDKALQLDPNYADALSLKASVLAKAANPAEAIRLLKRACELRPRNEEFKLSLARQYVTARRFDEADALLQRLQRSDDPVMVAAATQQIETSRRFQKSKLEQYAAESAEKYTAPQWRPKPGQKLDPEMEKLQNRNEISDEEGPDMRPVRFAKGVLLSSKCGDGGDVKMQVRVGARILDVFAPSKSTMLVMGAQNFNCNWKQRPVALHYRQRSSSSADLVSLELRHK